MPKEANLPKPQGFSEKIAEVWANLTPDRLTALLHRDVVFRQPHLPPIRGSDAAHREIRKLFTWLPNFFGTVDRFFLEEDLGKAREVYLYQMQMNGVILKHPKFWRGFVKCRFVRTNLLAPLFCELDCLFASKIFHLKPFSHTLSDLAVRFSFTKIHMIAYPT